jgi:hypothetical protein
MCSPGTISVSISADGHDGPLRNRAGFDIDGSAASGVMAIEGGDGAPKLPPTGMLNDFITGYLGAARATAALIRRATEGGSYHVKVSLARTGTFACSLGTVDPTLAGTSDEHRPTNPRGVTSKTALGELVQLAPPIRFTETAPRWHEPILVPAAPAPRHGGAYECLTHAESAPQRSASASEAFTPGAAAVISAFVMTASVLEALGRRRGSGRVGAGLIARFTPSGGPGPRPPFRSDKACRIAPLVAPNHHTTSRSVTGPKVRK